MLGETVETVDSRTGVVGEVGEVALATVDTGTGAGAAVTGVGAMVTGVRKAFAEVTSPASPAGSTEGTAPGGAVSKELKRDKRRTSSFDNMVSERQGIGLGLSSVNP